MNIRIYLDGTYHTNSYLGYSIEDNDSSNVFDNEGIYVIREPQGFVYNISAQNIYLSFFYTLIFFFCVFFCVFI